MALAAQVPELAVNYIMERIAISPRHNWERAVEQLGFGFHSTDVPYWDESVYYKFSLKEIEQLEKATNALWQMCLEAVQHVIDKDRFAEFQIPPAFRKFIIDSWDNDAPSIYNRFDLVMKDGQIKMLECNADTPTSLYEAGIVQWFWLQDFDENKDQFNSIHEKLIAYWKYLKPYLHKGFLHFSCIKDTLEDLTNTEYLRDCAVQAGFKTKLVLIDDIGWHERYGEFMDLEEDTIKNIFKLYPWEWLAKEEFGNEIISGANNMHWIEPAWKMILSNKAILPILWELFPNHEYLLPAYFTDHGMKSYVRKPILGREGANIDIVSDGKSLLQTEGQYGEEGYVYQELFTLPDYDKHFPVIGSWVIGQEAAGIGIREADGLVTGNTSRFVPHLIEG